MKIILSIVILIICSFAIGRFASLLVQSIHPLAKKFRVHKFAMSFLTIALAASIPELSIVLASSSIKDPSIGISAVLGASICDLTLVMGAAILLSRGLRVRANIKKNDIFYTTGICIVLALLLIEGSLSVYDSLILLFLYSFYIYNLLSRRDFAIPDRYNLVDGNLWKHSFFVILSIVGLILSSKGIVYSAESIANVFHIPIFLIGIIVVAIGASLPELFFEISAIRHHENDMVMGDIIGSVVTNTALLVGLIGLMNPGAQLLQGSINLCALFLVLVMLFLFIIIERTTSLSMRVGFILIFLYAAFIGTQIVVNYI